MFQSFARAGIAMLVLNSIALPASAQSLTDPGPIAPASDASPRNIIQRYTPLDARPPAQMSLLVDAPPSVGAIAQGPVSSAVTGGEVAAPIADRIDGPAINTLATGRSAISVTVAGAHRQ